MSCCFDVAQGLDAAHDACEETIRDAVTDQLGEEPSPDESEGAPPVLVDAIPSIGKTTSAAKLVAELCGQDGSPPITYLTHLTDNREDFEETVRELAGEEVSILHLPTVDSDCETATGQTGSGESQIERLRGRGVSPSRLHRDTSVSLPCQPDCPYMRPWERDFDNIDLLIGHLSHAYSPRVIDERVVFVDEDPEDSFERTFSSGEANKIASAYLRSLDSIPADDVDHVDDVERLLDIARDEHRVSLGRRAMEDRDFDVHGPEVVRTFFEPEVDDTDADRDSYRVDLLNGAQHIRLSERVRRPRVLLERGP